jgi:processive 1,2-diacylglycerol beta-glucosyltransferase
MTDNNRDKKIMLMYASAGAGHKMACKAIEQALIDNGFTGRILSIDTLDHMPKFIAALFSKGYLWAATKTPWLWYAIYESGANLSRFKPMSSWQASLFKLVLRRVNHLVVDEKPDYIISAYFTSSWLAGRYKYLHNPGCKAATVVTDYGLHTTWITPNQDRYFAATEDNRLELSRFSAYTGVGLDKITLAGIPVEKRYTTPKDKHQLKQKYGLDPERFTVLVLAGVYGPDHVYALIDKLAECKSKIQIVVVARAVFDLTGDRKQKLETAGIPYQAYGKIGFMEELMAAADIAITKTGGLTSSECFNSGCPLLIYLPYAGQEERNASLFLEMGAAQRIYQLESLAHKVDQIAGDPAKHQAMVEAAGRVVKPDAADTIAKTVMGDLGLL